MLPVFYPALIKFTAHTILNDQLFEFDREDLLEIQRMWKACTEIPGEGEGFDDEKVKLMMQNNYEGFISYLKDEQ